MRGLESKEKMPVEEILKNIIKRLGYTPTIDIIVVYCPYYERIINENILCRACKFYAEYGNKCPYSKDLNIVFIEVKSTRGKVEYEITESQKENIQ